MRFLLLYVCLVTSIIELASSWAPSSRHLGGARKFLYSQSASTGRQHQHAQSIQLLTQVRVPYSSITTFHSSVPFSDESNNDQSHAPMELPPHSSPASTNQPTSLDNTLTPLPQGSSFIQRVKSYLKAPSDGLTFRQRLAKLGLNAVLSYGWVSNMSYSVAVSLAWYIFSKQTGKSPLAPGQWKGFLAVYAGFFVFNNLVRPIRMALAVGVAPAFDRFVASIQTKLKVNKGTAIFITVMLTNLLGSIVAMSSGILLAATLAGVPVFAK
ncbi:hypothetical protein MPSEU_000313500 [Mayamaea pseudoterrestris]|nr:hypothetical protein MPSEU_000313500 [Mayamaea pseudoterrestris]